MENKKEMLLYNAGGCLMLGEIMQRKAEQQKLEELEIPMFNPINADHNDKKKNKNDGGFACAWACLRPWPWVRCLPAQGPP